MFRFNNPDALLVLLLVARRLRDDAGARDGARRAGSCWPACFVGFGFLTKMLQAFLVLPGFGLRVPDRRADRRCAGGSGTCCAAVAAMVVVGRLVGGDRRAVAGDVAARTSAARRTTAPRADASATTASAG